MQDHDANILKVRLIEYLRPAPNRGFYICPICGSGTGPNKTGALRVSPDGLHAKCFACDFYGDIFDIIGAEFHLDAAESYKKVADLFGQGHDIPVRPPDDTQVHPASQPPDSHQFDHYLADAARSLNNSPVALSYLKKRGFSRETIRRYRLGYDVKTRQIVIPYGDTGYFIRRGVGEGKTFYKPPTAQAGPEPLFNEPALDTADCVFVVESQLCALSVQQVGGAAVALGGAGTRRLLDRLERKKSAAMLILSLDNDERGARTQATLADALAAAEVAYVTENIAGEYKDPNEALQREPEQLAARVAAAREAALAYRSTAANQEKAAYLATSAAGHVVDFLNGVADSVNTPAVPTGFAGLDAALDGGLYEGLYVLGAISSLGKTTFMLQMADQIAKQSKDVVFFSLEMARHELMAKSISRLTWEISGGESANAKTTRGISDGKRYEGYSQKERDIIRRAVQAYQSFAGRLYIHEGSFDTGVNKIRRVVERHVTLTGKVPVVFIDYLQILAPDDPRATDKQNTDRAVFQLKQLSRTYKTPILAISSLNRENYAARMSLAAFKESGAIEYSSDVLLGLEFALPHGAERLTPELLDDLKRQDPRQIELRVLKNRNGGSGAFLALTYRAPYSCFIAESFVTTAATTTRR